MSDTDNRSRGVILIALLWILMALSVLALSFSRESYVEVAVSRNTRDLSDSYYIARAGMMATIYQLAERRFMARPVQVDRVPDAIDLGRVSGTFGDGSYDVEVQEESGKIGLNTVGPDQLRTLIEFIGITKPESDIIVDSVLDWREPGQTYRANGAKDDYYQSLNPPYKCKNGRFDSVEELLLVRGVTTDYFYGHPEMSPDGSIIYKYGLSRYLTVYSDRGSVNMNYAPLPVLVSVPGMTLELAQLIVEKRKTKPLMNPAEVARGLDPTKVNSNIFQVLSTLDTGVYTLTASGRRTGSKVRRTIKAVVILDPRQRSQYKIVYWNENVPNL